MNHCTEECTSECDWENLILSRSKELIIENSVVADVGANFGNYTKNIALQCKVDTVYAFEADKENFNQLYQNISELKNVKIINVALSDHVGEVEVFEGNGTPETCNIMGINSLQKNYILKDKVRCKVPCATLDFVFKEKIKEPINFIKIDVEGAELMVLDGCKRIIKDLDHLLVEIHNPFIFREIRKMCSKNKWLMRCLKHLHPITEDTDIDYIYQVVITPNK
jgi:FkbM family methyltransferase